MKRFLNGLAWLVGLVGAQFLLWAILMRTLPLVYQMVDVDLDHLEAMITQLVVWGTILFGTGFGFLVWTRPLGRRELAGDYD